MYSSKIKINLYKRFTVALLSIALFDPVIRKGERSRQEVCQAGVSRFWLSFRQPPSVIFYFPWNKKGSPPCLSASEEVVVVRGQWDWRGSAALGNQRAHHTARRKHYCTWRKPTESVSNLGTELATRPPAVSQSGHVIALRVLPRRINYFYPNPPPQMKLWPLLIKKHHTVQKSVQAGAAQRTNLHAYLQCVKIHRPRGLQEPR